MTGKRSISVGSADSTDSTTTDTADRVAQQRYVQQSQRQVEQAVADVDLEGI